MLLLPLTLSAQIKWNERFQQYIDQHKDIAIEQMKRWKVPASITLAQGLLESGAGQGWLTLNSNNGYFNNQPGVWNGSADFGTYDKGNTLFFACLMKKANHLVDLDFPSGFMPAPKLNEEQKNYNCISIGANVSVLPRNMLPSRYENVGIVLNAWAYYSSNDENAVITKYRETYLKNRMADDLENDSEMIQVIFDGVAYDLGNSVWGIALRLEIVKEVFLPLSTDYASVFASLVDTIKADIDTTVEKLQY